MRQYFTYLLFFIASQSFAQVNLVPNPSFEDKEYCPNGNVYKAAGWFTPIYGSPDIFTDSGSSASCYENCDWVGVYNSYTCFAGFQLPRSGNSYTGMKTLGSMPGASREYICTQLNDTLEAGKKYCVSFYTSLADNSGYGFDKIGVYFSPLPPSGCLTDIIIANNIFTNDSGSVIVDTLNWVLVSDTFVATGGELFITLGNFVDDSELQIVTTGVPSQFTYHYFDDISVIYCDSIVEPPPTPTVYSEITLFPNPSNGEFSITGNFPTGTQLSIYNMLGQKIGESIVLPEGNNLVSIDIQLAEGMYYYELRSPMEQVAEGKLLIVE